MNDSVQSIEQDLEKTNLGHYINQHKRGLGLLVAVVVILVVGSALYQSLGHKRMVESLGDVYQIQKDILVPFEKKELKAQEAAEKLMKVAVDTASTPAMLTTVFAVSNELTSEGNNELSAKLLERYLSFYSPKETPYLFLSMKLAVNLENANQVDRAIQVLESLVKAGHKVFEAKTYLDLGRLYTQKGEVQKARDNYNFIIENHKDTEFAKIAKLLLAQLGA